MGPTTRKEEKFRQRFQESFKRFSKFSKKFHETEGSSLIESYVRLCLMELYHIDFILKNLEPLLDEHQKIHEMIQNGQDPGNLGGIHEIKFWVTDYVIHSRILMDRLAVLAFVLIVKNPEKRLGREMSKVYRSFSSQRELIKQKGEKFNKKLSMFPSEYILLVEKADWFDDYLKEPRDAYTHPHLLDPGLCYTGLMSRADDKWSIIVPVPLKRERYNHHEEDPKSIKLKVPLRNMINFVNEYMDIFQNFTSGSIGLR